MSSNGWSTQKCNVGSAAVKAADRRKTPASAGQYWRLENLESFFLERRFPELWLSSVEQR